METIIPFSLGFLFGSLVIALLYSIKNKTKEIKIQLLKGKLEERQRQLEESVSFVENSKKSLMESFKALSMDVLQHNNRAFLDLAEVKLGKFQESARTDLNQRQKSIDDLLKPIKESLEKVDHTHQDLKKSLTISHASLTEQVKGLNAIQHQLQGETHNLVKALRTPHVRGRWGEMQLRRVVEIAGMIEYCDFVEQQTAQNEERRSRPDMIIKLPNKCQVVVDSKTALEAYLDAINTDETEVKISKFKDHARHVRNHITQLKSKVYWDQFDSAPEFVILFLPGEPFFSAALEYDPTLIEYGAQQKVILATPTTLIALLRAVAFGWSQASIAEDAKKISEMGKTLYLRLQKFSEHFSEIKRGLERTVDAYNQSLSSFESRLMVSAKQLHELGANDTQEIDPISKIEKVIK